MLINGCEEQGLFVEKGFFNVVRIFAMDLSNENQSFALQRVNKDVVIQRQYD